MVGRVPNLSLRWRGGVSSLARAITGLRSRSLLADHCRCGSWGAVGAKCPTAVGKQDVGKMFQNTKMMKLDSSGPPTHWMFNLV